MFRRLFKYISGVNQEGKEIEMTRPVSSLHKVGLQLPSFHPDLPVQGGEGGQPGQPRDAAHVLLLAFRVPAHTLSPPQGNMNVWKGR